MDHLQDGLEIIQSDLNIPQLTRIPCLAHVIQLALNSLVESVKIKAKNKKVIEEWDDENPNPEAHSSACRGDGAPWTLKKVRTLL